MIKSGRAGFANPRGRRGGFTLVELLVSVSVVSFLAALVLPAVQQSRAAARRAQCSNQVRQLAVAVHNHETAFGKPVTVLADASVNRRSSVHYDLRVSPFNSLAPYIEAASPIDVGSSLWCPSELSTHAQANASNYVLNGGVPEQALNAGRSGWEFTADAGCFGIVSPFGALAASGGPVPSASFRDVSDGLSQTLLWSERLIPVSETLRADASLSLESIAAAANGDVRRLVVSPQGLTSRSVDRLREECLKAAAEDLLPDGTTLGGRFLRQNSVGRPVFTTSLVPNSPSCHAVPPVGYGRELSPASPLSASSLHAGGVIAAFCDGRVTFVSQAIDAAVWRASGTRAAAEPESVY